jgi:DNA-binding transcriptional LysR family regulator
MHVSQPSLTRAIKQLEGELGGDLFRRECPQAQSTELGERMLPLLKQCYESALGARSLASAIKTGEIGTLRHRPDGNGDEEQKPIQCPRGCRSSHSSHSISCVSR